MPKEDEYLNKFKTALTSTIKAIAEDPELEVKFGNSITSKKKFICLPETKDIKSDYTHIRALADSEALKIKFFELKFLFSKLILTLFFSEITLTVDVIAILNFSFKVSSLSI